MKKSAFIHEGLWTTVTGTSMSKADDLVVRKVNELFGKIVHFFKKNPFFKHIQHWHLQMHLGNAGYFILKFN